MIKQRIISRKIGAVLDSYSRAQIFVNPISQLMIAMTFYQVTIREYAPWLNIALFVVALLFIVSFVMLLVYLFVTPSSYSYTNYQSWEHDNPFRKDLELIKARLGIGTVENIETGNIDDLIAYWINERSENGFSMGMERFEIVNNTIIALEEQKKSREENI